MNTYKHTALLTWSPLQTFSIIYMITITKLASFSWALNQTQGYWTDSLLHLTVTITFTFPIITVHYSLLDTANWLDVTVATMLQCVVWLQYHGVASWLIFFLSSSISWECRRLYFAQQAFMTALQFIITNMRMTNASHFTAWFGNMSQQQVAT
jgi:hypothetical protein